MTLNIDTEISVIIEKVISALIIGGVTWLVVTTIELKSELELLKHDLNSEIRIINYKLDNSNRVLQDLYEVKKDK